MVGDGRCLEVRLVPGSPVLLDIGQRLWQPGILRVEVVGAPLLQPPCLHEHVGGGQEAFLLAHAHHLVPVERRSLPLLVAELGRQGRKVVQHLHVFRGLGGQHGEFRVDLDNLGGRGIVQEQGIFRSSCDVAARCRQIELDCHSAIVGIPKADAGYGFSVGHCSSPFSFESCGAS